MIRGSADGVLCLISSLCLVITSPEWVLFHSVYFFSGCANAFVFFIRRFSVWDLKCTMHLKMRRVFETALSLSGIVLFLLEVAYMDKILYESKSGRPG